MWSTNSRAGVRVEWLFAWLQDCMESLPGSGTHTLTHPGSLIAQRFS